jgi:demethoxyubiquinone hydroxylase (CLK1/Coq7/Cat5 family)
MKDAKTKLIELLQKAYSGERAAALAYNGHWKSLKEETEIRIIKKIELDEWRHRARIGEMLSELNVKPLFFREFFFYLIGRTIGFICHFCGNFLAAFFAGILENKNVQDYGLALKYAEEIGLVKYFDDFKKMEIAEAEHEFVLREMIKTHRFFPLFAFVFRWGNF